MGDFDYLDAQNIEIRKKAKKEIYKGIAWLIASVILFASAYSSGKIYLLFILMFLWSVYRIFVASKFFFFGRHAVEFPKEESKPTSAVINGKIYKHKD